MNCNACQGTGFHNLHQLDDDQLIAAGAAEDFHEHVVATHCEDDESDVCVCDCCGDGIDSWHGTPGQHYGDEDPRGADGPYADNEGVCQCH